MLESYEIIREYLKELPLVCEIEDIFIDFIEDGFSFILEIPYDANEKPYYTLKIIKWSGVNGFDESLNYLKKLQSDCKKGQASHGNLFYPSKVECFSHDAVKYVPWLTVTIK